MKRLFAVILALVLALSCCASLAEETVEPVECPEEAKLYEGLWRNVDATIEIYWEELGYKVMIVYPHGDGKETHWEYSCSVTDDNKLLAMPMGLRIEVEGDKYEQVYDDGEAEFFINDENFLEWKNLKEEIEFENQFVKVSPGDYDGYWASEDYVIEMFFEEEGYRILIRDNEGKETYYNGFYHEDDNTVVSFEGDVVISKNEDGNLVWNGIAFELLDPIPAEEQADG